MVIPAAALEETGRRAVIYVVWDRRGEVGDFIVHALEGLRDHAHHILVVVNGSLSDDGRKALEAVSDDILVRKNTGFDIWAHKEGLERLGPRTAEFDEIVLTNDTWYGPVRPYGAVLERMDSRPLHFWGMTDHAREEPNPFTNEGVLHYHLQSFWIAVRREMFLSEAWTTYWRDLPPMPGYFDAVLRHETVFTEHFAQLGYVHGVAYPSEDYPTDHPALFNPDLLMADGCPLLKRRPFFHYPPFLDRHAVIGREIIRDVDASGYPVALIWRDLSRNVAPRVLNADAAMLEVLPDVDVSYDGERPMRIAAVLHIDHPDMTDEMLDRVGHLPGEVDVVITTPDAGQADQIRRVIHRREDDSARVEVRVVRGAHGRHMGAFFIDCRDVLREDRYDLVVKLHSKLPRRKPYNVGRYFTRHQFENLLNSPGYAANLVALFQREEGLGVVFPPMVHIGVPTIGNGWSVYRPRIEALVKTLGIRVPLDDVSPLAPLGGMWVARPQALRILADAGWSYRDFDPAHGPAPLASTLERLVAYAAGELGYHTRTVLSFEHADISHTALEFKLDQLSSTTPGYPVEQIQFLHRAGWTGHGGVVGFMRMYLRLNHPGFARATDPFLDLVRGGVVRAKNVRNRIRGRS